jgi:hypothetical protein
MGMEIGAEPHFQQYFSHLMVVSLIGGVPGENHQPAEAV